MKKDVKDFKSFTLGSFFNSKKYGFATGVGLLVIYGLVYWLIRMESINLLAGTILLYILLIIMMIHTAKLNQAKNIQG